MSQTIESKNEDSVEIPTNISINSEFDPHKITKIKSVGVRKIEILNKQYDTVFLRVILFFSIFLVAYTYSLDGTIRYTFQSYATSSYASHSLLSTINVIKSVIAAAAQPTYARLSDYFGRLELFVTAVLFYVVGTVIESQAYDIERFAGGSILYQIGYTGSILLLQVILADFSNLNWRLVCSFIPALPFIINTWVSGNVSDALLSGHSWNYSIGIFAFIYPLSCIPFIGCLLHMWHKASKTEEWKLLKQEKTDFQKLGFWKFCKFLFWKLDLPGVLFIICILGFILTPLTIAGGVHDKWAQGSIIAPLVIGFALIPPFIVWEVKFAMYPITPYNLLKDRGVYAAIIIAVFIDLIYYLPVGNYMYTALVVSMNQSIKAASRISSLYSFVSVIAGPLVGLLVVRVRRTKGLIIFGVVLWIVSNGLFVYFRGGSNSVAGIIGSYILLGIGAGFFTYTTQTSIQACTNHEHLSVVTAIYLAAYNIGSAFGASISGAIWSNILYPQLLKKFNNDESLASSAYSSPFEFILTNTWGSPNRQLVVEAYRHTQKILCIVGLSLCFPLLAACFLLRDHKLESVQSLEFDQTAENNALFDNDDDYLIILFKKIFHISKKTDDSKIVNEDNNLKVDSVSSVDKNIDIEK